MKNNRLLPAYPIFVKDPSFSLWSCGDQLNGSNLRAWWGGEKRVYGFLKTKGKTFCFLGNGADFASCGVENAEQTALSVTAFSTDYEFKAGGVKLKLRFVSPLLPSDLEIISLPVCYMEYEIEGDAQAEISLFAYRSVAYNGGERTPDRSVRGATMPLNGFKTAFLGLCRQLPLSNNGDLVGADWGYYYLAGEQAYYLDERSLGAYLASGQKKFSAVGEDRYVGAIGTGKAGVLLMGYDETVSIDYYGSLLKGYYLEKHTIFEALQTVWDTHQELDKKLAAFDADLAKKAAVYGEEYRNVLNASLRQSIAAHKLVRDPEGNVLFLSKECGSNGCIATVDVSYPSMPLYLLLNPELVKGMMRPILKFAKMPCWAYDFAPHDAGTYPHCCGQVYGINRKSEYNDFIADGEYGTRATHFPFYLLPAPVDLFDFDTQMPVEECANLLIMWLACYRADGDISFFRNDKELADKWVKYLVEFGLKPENQLCTDDFAGHLKNNLNLAIKATVGIAAYAELCKAAGTPADEFRKIAEDFAKEITAFGAKFKHLPLTWDSDDTTFSLKYNLAFDKIYRLGLFEQDILEREVDCYLARAGKYGTPLDSRADYTKSDWLMWAAALTDDKSKRVAMVKMLDAFLKESKDRIPFSDWYDTKDGGYLYFRARSVQGGCFILLL